MKDKINMNNTEMTDKEEEMKEQLYRDYLEFLRITKPSFEWDWGLALVTVLITLVTVGGFSLNIVHLIEMLVEHKFVWWRAGIDIFFATILLGEWVFYIAKPLKEK